jgi:hypothetical protein
MTSTVSSVEGASPNNSEIASPLEDRIHQDEGGADHGGKHDVAAYASNT